MSDFDPANIIYEPYVLKTDNYLYDFHNKTITANYGTINLRRLYQEQRYQRRNNEMVRLFDAWIGYQAHPSDPDQVQYFLINGWKFKT